jgi:hypothetical protein
MSKRGGERRGGDGSDGDYDMELVEKIMETIQSHHEGEHINPNLKSLRSTMLAASALLHLAYVEAYGETGETFQDAAQDCFTSIAATAVSIRQRRN